MTGTGKDEQWKDRLFVGNYGYVFAAEKRTGQEIWRTSLPGTGNEVITLLYNQGVLYAGSKGYVFAINPETGGILWGRRNRREEGFKALFRGLARDICMAVPESEQWKDRVFIGYPGYIAAIEKRTGEEIRVTELSKEYLWSKPAIVTLFYYDGKLYAGCNGKLFAIDPETHRSISEYALRSGHVSMAAPRESEGMKRIFVAPFGYVSAIETETCHELWRINLPNVGYETVTLFYEAGLLYAAAGRMLFALDPKTGDIRWKTRLYTVRWKNGLKTAGALLHIRGGVCMTTEYEPGPQNVPLFVGAYGHVIAEEKQTGWELWRVTLPDSDYGIVTVHYGDGQLYASSQETLYAMEPEWGNFLWEKPVFHGPVLMATSEGPSTLINDLALFKHEEYIQNRWGN